MANRMGIDFTQDGWHAVVYAADCDEDGNCPHCLIDYADCPCPGPTQDGMLYAEHQGKLYARPVSGSHQAEQPEASKFPEK